MIFHLYVVILSSRKTLWQVELRYRRTQILDNYIFTIAIYYITINLLQFSAEEESANRALYILMERLTTAERRGIIPLDKIQRLRCVQPLCVL